MLTVWLYFGCMAFMYLCLGVAVHEGVKRIRPLAGQPHVQIAVTVGIMTVLALLLCLSVPRVGMVI